MKEELIRPEDMKKKIKELHKKDVEDIIKSKDKFTEVDCPTCKSNERKGIFEKNKFEFKECKLCKTIYISPRPTADMLEKFYTESRNMKFWNEHVFPKTEANRKELIVEKRANKILDLCKKYNNDFGTIVDVGAGFGTFCEVMIEKKAFDRVIAVETSKSLAETCANKGIDTINAPVEKTSICGSSVIVSFEVIEHLFEPYKFVEACYEALDEKGLLFLTTPNIEGFEMSMLMTLDKNKDTPNIGGPDHLNYFSVETIKIFLEKNRFEVLEILTPGELDVDLVRQKLELEDYDFSNMPLMKKVILEENLSKEFQKFLVNNKLSSHMWVVARKAK